VARVTLAVLTYNGRELLDVVLPSALALDYADRRVVVVDNGSGDGTIEHVRERYPDVEVVALGRNLGVSAGLNRCVEAADGEYVALLNNDLELEPGWLGPLVEALDADPGAASASGKLLRYRDRDRIDAAGDWLLWSGATINRGHGEPDDGRYGAPETVFAACAGAALYRRAAFADVGPFDESFFAYIEDVDWAMRAQLRGWRSRYVPAARAFHMGGETARRTPERFARLQARNALVFVAKTFPRWALVRHGWKVALHHALWLGAAIREGRGRAHLGAWADAARALPAALRARRQIQAGARASRAELEALVARGVAGDTALERLAFELAPAAVRRRRGAVL